MRLRNAIFYVADIEKSKKFYESIGFEVDKDFGRFVSFRGETKAEGTLAIALADKPDKSPGKQVASFLVTNIDDLLHNRSTVLTKSLLKSRDFSNNCAISYFKFVSAPIT
jgi:catechol 2,3-dioxygenase-like lactoylglutathione lyase family enzyme